MYKQFSQNYSMGVVLWIYISETNFNMIERIQSKQVKTILSLAPTRRFFLASGLCLSLPNISCVGLRQVKQRNELSHLAFLMRSIASLLLKHKHVYALLLCRVCVCVCLCT